MSKAIKINKKIKTTNKGKIYFFNKFKLIKFNLKRFFIITPNNKLSKRGEHAHKLCDQIMILTEGQAKISIYKKKYKHFNLSKNQGIFVPKKHWVEIKFKRKKSSLLVLCNYKFNLKEYILNKAKLV